MPGPLKKNVDPRPNGAPPMRWRRLPAGRAPRARTILETVRWCVERRTAAEKSSADKPSRLPCAMLLGGAGHC